MKKSLFSAARRGGFTLVELLVVIGIILVLIAILLPVIGSAKHKADIARIRQDLNTISTALEEYKKVFNDYPRSANPSAIGHTPVLVTYLLGPNGDGIREVGTGPTGSQTQGGKKWGPYLPADKFKTNGNQLLDVNGMEIQYYPRYNAYDARPGAPLNNTGTGDGYLMGRVSVTNAQTIRAMFSRYEGLAGDGTIQNGINLSSDHQLHTLYMLGDGADNGTPAPNNRIDSSDKYTETLTFNGPFILVSAGPDKRWGMFGGTYTKHTQVDDVYNFER